MSLQANKPLLIFGGDHAGFQARVDLIKKLENDGYKCFHVGNFDTNSCNYAEYAIKVGEMVKDNPNALGIVVCGTGIGVCMAVNKVPNILAGLAYNVESAKLIKEHDNCNVLALGARQFDTETLYMFCQVFLNAEFQGGRHLERINYIKNYENNK